MPMFHIATLSGSPAESSRSCFLLRSAEAQLNRIGIATHAIAINRLPPAQLLQFETAGTELKNALSIIASADALIIATPIYKAAYSGVLKTFLDLLPQDGLDGKPVLPIATAGSAAHLLALDYTLKPLLTTLGARHLLASVLAIDTELHKEGERYVAESTLIARLTAGVAELATALPRRAPAFPARITPTWQAVAHS